MRWIKIDVDTPSKPAIVRLANDCGVSRGDAFLAWFDLYAWLDEQTADGRLEINGRRTAAEALVGKASVRVGSFEFEVSSEQSGERKSRRETASDILYAHALSQLSRTFSDSASEDALELEKRVDASLDDILARGLPDFEGLDDNEVAKK